MGSPLWEEDEEDRVLILVLLPGVEQIFTFYLPLPPLFAYRFCEESAIKGLIFL